VITPATRALVDLKFAAKGTLGGWIEKEENLDAEGDAWVSGDAATTEPPPADSTEAPTPPPAAEAT